MGTGKSFIERNTTAKIAAEIDGKEVAEHNKLINERIKKDFEKAYKDEIFEVNGSKVLIEYLVDVYKSNRK